VRQDLIQLFGFPTLVEKEWHRLLTSVQGIGSKAAMAIMGTLGADGVSRAIAIGDWGAVKAAPGVGPKIAQRVVNELKDKAPSIMAMGADAHDTLDAEVIDAGDVTMPAPKPKKPAKTSKASVSAAAQADALSALGNLGYGPSEAASAVATAAGDHDGADTSTLIREALKLLAPKG
jgi:Holliday junction DNA helicase RuvA